MVVKMVVDTLHEPCMQNHHYYAWLGLKVVYNIVMGIYIHAYNIIRMLYIRPILEYASTVWAPYIKSSIQKLEATQNRISK